MYLQMKEVIQDEEAGEERGTRQKCERNSINVR